MSSAGEQAEAIDFESAEQFLRTARKAHDDGDHVQCLAARKLVAIALHLTEGPRVRFSVAHLDGK